MDEAEHLQLTSFGKLSGLFNILFFGGKYWGDEIQSRGIATSTEQ